MIGPQLKYERLSLSQSGHQVEAIRSGREVRAGGLRRRGLVGNQGSHHDGDAAQVRRLEPR